MTAHDTDDGGTRLELYVRSLSPAGARSRQDAVIARLTALTECETIAGYDVHVWGTGIRPASPAARTASGRFALERLTAFEDWARRNGLTLGGGFRTEGVHSTLTGESYTERTFPILTLAQFREGNLQRVAPCRDDEATYSVEDCLDAIENGRPFAGDAESVPLFVGRDRQERTGDDEDNRNRDPSPLAVSSSVGE